MTSCNDNVQYIIMQAGLIVITFYMQDGSKIYTSSTTKYLFLSIFQIDNFILLYYWFHKLKFWWIWLSSP